MKLLAKFNLIFLVVFGAGGLLISQVARSYLIGHASDEVREQERLMMASARSVRDYTSEEISPLLRENPRHRVRFLPETIPFYGATTTFARLRKGYPDYVYKEAALNPTNPEDRATGWEVDIIDWLRDHRDQHEKTGQRNTPMGPAIYLANPIVATKECLECHSSPAAAPKIYDYRLRVGERVWLEGKRDHWRANRLGTTFSTHGLTRIVPITSYSCFLR